jgi:SAM-dependent methyltransferase
MQQNNLKWPKKLPELSEEQKKIREDFVKHWHEVLPQKYSLIEVFNHKTGIKIDNNLPDKYKTLEIGAGIGGHIGFENLEKQEYYALELRQSMANILKEKFPAVNVVVGDIQKNMNFSENYFDRIIAVHVLEHLPDLPSALKNIKNLLKPDGFCDFVLPCEGSFAYSLARRISAKRIFEKKYKCSYDWFVKSEHINTYYEIIEEIGKAGYKVIWKKFFPFPVNLVFCNLVVGLKCIINK